MIDIDRPRNDVPQNSPTRSEANAQVSEAFRRLESIGRDATEQFEVFSRFAEVRREIITKTVARYWLAKSLHRQMANGCEDLDSQILRTNAAGVLVRVEKLLLQLDAVESHNDETVRYLRRQLVSRLSGQLAEMEKFLEKLKRLIAFQAEKDAAARELLNRSSPKKKHMMGASDAVALGVEQILGSAGLLGPLDPRPTAATTMVTPKRAELRKDDERDEGEGEVRSSRASSSSSSISSSSSSSSSTPREKDDEEFVPPTRRTSSSPTGRGRGTTSVHTSPSAPPRRVEEPAEEALEEPEYTVQDRKHAVVITVRDPEAQRGEIELRGRDGAVLSVCVPGRRRVQFALDPDTLNVRQATKELLSRNVLQIVIPRRRFAATVPSYHNDAAFRDFFLRGWPKF